MDILIKILQFIASFSLLIFIHELGHYLFARMFGIRVEKFYLFFNPGFSLLKFRIGHTEYGIGWVPFGGYVKIAGMIDESMDTGQMAGEPKPYEFRSKPAWQRLLVMIGGVLMNVVLALAIFIGMSFTYGDRYISNNDLVHGYVFNELGQEMGFRNGDRILSVGGRQIDDMAAVYLEMVISQAREVEVLRGESTRQILIPETYTAAMLESPDFMEPRIPFVVAQAIEGHGAAAAGIQPGDSLIALNGEPLGYFDEYRPVLGTHAGERVELTVVRDSASVKVERTIPVEVSPEGTIGVYPQALTAYVPVHTRQYSLMEAVPAGIKRTGMEIGNYWKQIKLLVKPSTGAYKSIGGPLTMGSIFPRYWSWEIFWRITAFFSIVLAIMNILPIPALDGGHVLFLLYEMITGRKPGDSFMVGAQMFGMVIILGLLLLATSNDIFRFFIK